MGVDFKTDEGAQVGLRLDRSGLVDSTARMVGGTPGGEDWASL